LGVGKSVSLPTPTDDEWIGDLEDWTGPILAPMSSPDLTRKWQQFAGYQQHDAQERCHLGVSPAVSASKRRERYVVMSHDFAMIFVHHLKATI